MKILRHPKQGYPEVEVWKLDFSDKRSYLNDQRHDLTLKENT